MRFNLEYVLDSALDGVFIVANDYRLVLFNRACEELYGISREDVLDKALAYLRAKGIKVEPVTGDVVSS